MPTLNINITAINGTTATYDKASGPGTVSAAGEIDFQGSSANAAVDIAWTLDSSLNKTFAAGGFSAQPVAGKTHHDGEFTLQPLSNDNRTLTVTDNNDAGDQYEYTLSLSGGPDLDPKIINR